MVYQSALETTTSRCEVSAEGQTPDQTSGEASACRANGHVTTSSARRLLAATYARALVAQLLNNPCGHGRLRARVAMEGARGADLPSLGSQPIAYLVIPGIRSPSRRSEQLWSSG